MPSPVSSTTTGAAELRSRTPLHGHLHHFGHGARGALWRTRRETCLVPAAAPPKSRRGTWKRRRCRHRGLARSGIDPTAESDFRTVGLDSAHTLGASSGRMAARPVWSWNMRARKGAWSSMVVAACEGGREHGSPLHARADEGARYSRCMRGRKGGACAGLRVYNVALPGSAWSRPGCPL